MSDADTVMTPEDEPATLRVEVAYAQPETQVVIPIEVPTGTTLAQAIALSGIAARFPGLDTDAAAVGIFGALVKDRSQVLRDGDRVEIYRPLQIDPKAARANRASAKRRKPDEGA